MSKYSIGGMNPEFQSASSRPLQERSPQRRMIEQSKIENRKIEKSSRPLQSASNRPRRTAKASGSGAFSTSLGNPREGRILTPRRIHNRSRPPKLSSGTSRSLWRGVEVPMSRETMPWGVCISKRWVPTGIRTWPWPGRCDGCGVELR